MVRWTEYPEDYKPLAKQQSELKTDTHGSPVIIYAVAHVSVCVCTHTYEHTDLKKRDKCKI